MAKKKHEDEYEDPEEAAREEARERSREKAAGMVRWTRRSAFFLGFCAFIVMFLLSFDFENYLSMHTDNQIRHLIICVVKSLCAFLLFWVSGLIIGNIFVKGLVTDVPVDQSHLVEGGMLQRIYLYQQKLNYDADGNIIQIDPRTDKVVRGTPKQKGEEGAGGGKA